MVTKKPAGASSSRRGNVWDYGFMEKGSRGFPFFRDLMSKAPILMTPKTIGKHVTRVRAIYYIN